ncbi:c-type cytochrome [Pseudooceanicola sp. LIPI14-2-Ac024]|uniref:c-type cytochrome n=1 Tax=Pseudooceanicola sp. LIPI14-2-Ac024 TaxID=3344875 RepID=UPI0035D122EB
MTLKPAFALAALAMLAAPAWAGDAAKGQKEFGKCRSCHTIANGDEVIQKGGKTGPNLFGVVGRQAGTADFKYGDDIVAAGENGLVWDEAMLATYMEDPRAFLQDYLDDKGAKSKMTFKMRKGAEDVAAYLATLGAGDS